MEARRGQNRDNKIAPQVNFNPTAPNIMARCVFSSSPNNTFFSVLVIIISNMSYFCFNYTNTFFIRTTNYFSVVLRIIFLMCIENYFFIGPRIIFRVITNLFFGPKCIAGLADEGDWFEYLTSLATILKTLQVEECFQRCNAKAKHYQARERHERGFHLSYKI